jgi:alpha/beta superfamily hydrolase
VGPSGGFRKAVTTSGMRSFRLAVGLMVLVGLLGACGGDDATAAAPKGSREVLFPGPEGSTLAGRELGSGPVAIVLAHGAATTMASWYAPMPAFAAAGYRVLAYDSRGVGESSGPSSTDPSNRAQDIEAAVRYLRGRGASKVVVMGSSLGAYASLTVAGEEDLAAVVGVSPAAIPPDLDAVTAPAFFVASAGDRGPAENARELGRHFGRRARIVSGSVHGADLFTDHPEATRAVIQFLAEVVPASA